MGLEAMRGDTMMMAAHPVVPHHCLPAVLGWDCFVFPLFHLVNFGIVWWHCVKLWHCHTILVANLKLSS